MFNVSPAAGTTAGELLDHVLSHQDIKESYYYCIAASDAGEYLPLSGDTKISKVAPAGWKADGRSHAPPVHSFSLFLRFKLLPDDSNAFTRFDAETHVVKNGQTTLWAANLFADAMCCKNRGVAVGFVFHA